MICDAMLHSRYDTCNLQMMSYENKKLWEELLSYYMTDAVILNRNLEEHSSSFNRKHRFLSLSAPSLKICNF